MTHVSVIDYVEVEAEKLQYNYMVTVKYYDRLGEASRVERYVYPIKVWDKVQHVVSPLLEDKAPRNPGVIFIGPPGTGKSSLLRIIPEYLGLSAVEVGVEAVLSKWVGESEQKIDLFFSEAEMSEPSALLLDEGDWVLSPARESGGLSEVSHNVLSIVKRKLSDYYVYRKKVLVMFSANLSESAIDSTLKREGRCGKPIVIPLPDYEAIYSYLTEAAGVDDEVAERMALDAVNAGLSMADVVNMAQTYVETGRYVVEPMRYRGYRRYVVPSGVLTDSSVKELLESVEKAYDFTSISNYRRARVWVAGLKATVSLPLVAAIIGLIARKPVVVIDHEKYIDEAVDMVNLLGAVAIVNHNVIHPEHVKTLWMTGDFPIVFISETPPHVEHAQLNLHVFFENIHYRPGVIRVITETYGIKLRDQEVKELLKSTSTDFLSALERIALTGRLIPAFRRV